MTSQLETLHYILQSTTSIKLHTDKISELLKSLTDEEKIEASSSIKTVVQQEVIDTFNRSGGRGCVYVATGVGKSKIGIDLASRILFRSEAPTVNKRVLLVVPTEKLRDENWQLEFAKWGKQDIYFELDRCCYASLNKFEGQTFDLVILDEGHNITENNSKFFLQNEVKSCILLTATKPENPIKLQILKDLGLNSVYELSLDEAVKLGIVTPFDITVVTVSLNNILKNIKGGNKDNPFFQTEKSAYAYLFVKAFESPNKHNIMRRMRFIYNSVSKESAAKFILESIIPKHLKTLIFCGSISQANEICTDRFHTKTDDNAFEAFKGGLINRLSCVDSLNEGHNIDNLDTALVIQLNSQRLDFIQRLGRLVRFKPNSRGKMIILCLENTVDKGWIESALTAVNKSSITWIEFSRLREGIEKISF